MTTAKRPMETHKAVPARVRACGGRRSVLAALALLLSLMVVAAALRWGAAGLDPRVIWQLRAPRVLAAAGVGALLALSGLAMQIVLRNPLADPYVLGTSGGASVGALLALMLGANLWAGAAAGALACAAALLWLARAALRQTDDASVRLILLGAMLAALTGAAAQLMLSLVPDRVLRGAVFWMGGDFSAARDHGVCLAAAVLLAALMSWRARSVERLMLGSETAALLGERVALLRAMLLGGASLAVAASVATAGAIGFVGLVVPHMLRLCGVHGVRAQAAWCVVAGATLLVAADLVARTVASPMELPVGAVTALVGAPAFVWFLWRDVR